MSSTLYPLGRQAFGEASINWNSDNIRCVVVSSTYVYSDLHQYHSDLTGILGTSSNLSGKSNVLGVFDAADPTITGVSAGSTVAGVAVYKWTGTSGTSPLIIFYDHNISGSALAAPTDGSGIPIHWPNGPTKMFRI